MAMLNNQMVYVRVPFSPRVIQLVPAGKSPTSFQEFPSERNLHWVSSGISQPRLISGTGTLW